MTRRQLGWIPAAVLLTAVWTAQTYAAPITFSASGNTTADIQASVDAFRAALGNPNNANAPGPLASGRREINWDGGGATAPAPAGTPFAGFQNTRGALMTTAGTGFLQAQPGDLGNAAYATTFGTFSPSRLFTPVGSNVTDVTFFLPGTSGASSAAVSGFGAVFTDVDLANTTRLEFFGLNNVSLLSSFVPNVAVAGANLNQTFSFLGVRFNAGELITRVRITTGNNALGAVDSSTNDVVAMDDFIYAEPTAVPEPTTLALVSLGLLGARAARKRR